MAKGAAMARDPGVSGRPSPIAVTITRRLPHGGGADSALGYEGREAWTTDGRGRQLGVEGSKGGRRRVRTVASPRDLGVEEVR